MLGLQVGSERPYLITILRRGFYALGKVGTRLRSSSLALAGMRTMFGDKKGGWGRKLENLPRRERNGILW